VPAVGDEPYDGGWVSPLNRAIYPPPAHRRTPGDDAAGCPTFKKDSVLERPDGGIATAATVAPGTHRMLEGVRAYDVVWWDPGVLHLGVEPPYGLRRQELIAKDVPPHVIEEGAARHRAWHADRQAALARGRVPWAAVSTMTEWAAGDAAGLFDSGPLNGVPDSEVVTVGTASGRPSGTRFGTLVHATLATVPLDSSRPALEMLVATHGRIVGADAAEVAAAVTVVEGVLRPYSDDRRAALDRLNEISLWVFDRYPPPAVLGAETWSQLRDELAHNLDVIGIHAVKAAKDIPVPFAERYFELMPIHEKLRASEFPTITNYLRVTMCNIHEEFSTRIDAPTLAQAVRAA